jgi:hypothetical protein
VVSVVTHFWVSTKQNKNENEKIQKNIQKNQKIIEVRKGCWNAEKKTEIG